MKRKRLLTIVAVFVAIATALLSTPVLVSVFSQPTINREAFDRIRIGMTRRELYECLGGEPGHYAAGFVVYSDGDKHFAEDEWWYGDDGAIGVIRGGGNVRGKEFRDVERSEYNGLQKLVWHFRHGWQKLCGFYEFWYPSTPPEPPSQDW
jgi:hypothetical protein